MASLAVYKNLKLTAQRLVQYSIKTIEKKPQEMPLNKRDAVNKSDKK
jgi:hypothetical protein